MINAEPGNSHPTYTKPTDTNEQSNNLTTQDFELFWRPIWEKETQETPETPQPKWIKDIGCMLNAQAPTPTTAPQDITVDFLYNSIKKKRNWSAPGYDKITNFWIKKLTVLHKDLTSALTQIINSEITLLAWLQEGRCVMIPKKESPSAKDHRPITCLNTTYKAITSVINDMLNKHEERHQLMQVDQRGCKHGSMGCIDNLLIDKAILEDAQSNRKNISCVWVDVKKAFDSVSYAWLECCLHHYGLPTKITALIKNIMKNWKITLDVQTKDGRAKIGPITLNRGILQGDSFCVRLFTMCLNPIAWNLRNNEGYVLTKLKYQKLK